MESTVPNPLVSLVLVTANRADWLAPVLDSVQAQSEPSWELVAVDCCSEDGTLALLESRAALDDRIKVISLEETDKGTGRRQGLRAAKGHYVAFPDANSLWSADFLREHLKLCKQHPETGAISYTPAQVLGNTGEVRCTVPQEPGHGSIIRELFEQPQLALSSLLIERQVVKRLQKTGMRFWLANDHALLIWLAYRLPFKSTGREPLVQVRPIDGQLPVYLDPVSEARGKALTHALEQLPRVVSARFARRCLARYYRARSVSLALSGNTGDAFSSAMRALMYRPLWFRAWQQLLRLALNG